MPNMPCANFKGNFFQPSFPLSSITFVPFSGKVHSWGRPFAPIVFSNSCLLVSHSDLGHAEIWDSALVALDRCALQLALHKTIFYNHMHLMMNYEQTTDLIIWVQVSNSQSFLHIRSSEEFRRTLLSQKNSSNG